MSAYFVYDNITGTAASHDFDTEEKATGLCRSMNLSPGAGSRFSVQPRLEGTAPHEHAGNNEGGTAMTLSPLNEGLLYALLKTARDLHKPEGPDATPQYTRGQEDLICGLLGLPLSPFALPVRDAITHEISLDIAIQAIRENLADN